MVIAAPRRFRSGDNRPVPAPDAPNATALLLIDIQKEYFLAHRPLFVPDGAKVLDRIIPALTLWHQRGWPVVHVRHEAPPDAPLFAKGSFAQQPHKAAPEGPNDLVVMKSKPGAFTGTPLEGELRARGVTAVIVCGFMTQLCCDTTAREADALGFKVFFPDDATSCPPLKDRGYGPLSAAQARAQVHTVIQSFATVAPLASFLPAAPEFPATARLE